MEKQAEVITINTDAGTTPQVTGSLIEGRKNVVSSLDNFYETKVTIYVQAYNRLEKTKACIESILKYTGDIDYELFLVDNGSTDETLAYFKEVPYPKKRILHITKNVGAMFPNLLLSIYQLAPFAVFLGNDIIVTSGWLSNLIRGMEEDKRIGMVCPVSSNVSNFQQINLPFSNLEEMQQQAAVFNRPDTSKWQERLRLVTPATVYRMECLMAVGLPLADVGFFHDFADDDIAFRVRRAGYKAMLAGDTWIHHNHDLSHGEGKDPEQFRQSLSIGRNNFMEKYQGVDAWDDVNNFWIDILDDLPPTGGDGQKRILGVDTRCGTPILDVKNRLRSMGFRNTELSAFTEESKYQADLNTVCDGVVACDREEFFGRQYPTGYFDYVVVDKPLNRFHEPQFILDEAVRLLKPDGILLFTLLNTFSFREYLFCRGDHRYYNPQFAYNIPIDILQKTVYTFGKILFTKSRMHNIDGASQEYLLSTLPDRNALPLLLVDTYVMGVQKTGN